MKNYLPFFLIMLLCSFFSSALIDITEDFTLNSGVYAYNSLEQVKNSTVSTGVLLSEDSYGSLYMGKLSNDNSNAVVSFGRYYPSYNIMRFNSGNLSVGKGIVLIKKFNNVMTLDNRTFVEFFYNTSNYTLSGSDKDSFGIDLVFKKSNELDNCGLIDNIRFLSSPSGQGYYYMCGVQADLRISPDFFIGEPNTDYKNHSLSNTYWLYGSAPVNKGSKNGLNKTFEFDVLYIVIYKTLSTANDTIWLHNIYVNNIVNGSNMLPSVNFSLQDQVICSNNTYPISVNTTVSSFDAEGDTVYYSLSKEASYYIKDRILFDNYDLKNDASWLWSLDSFLSCNFLGTPLIGVLGQVISPCTPFEKTGAVLDLSMDNIDTNCNVSTDINNLYEQNKTVSWSYDTYSQYMLSVNASRTCGIYDNLIGVVSHMADTNDNLQGLSFMLALENDTRIQVEGNKNFKTILLNRTGGQTDVYVDNSKIYSTHSYQLAIKITADYATSTYTLSLMNVSRGNYSLNSAQQNYSLISDLPLKAIYIRGFEGQYYLDNILFYRDNLVSQFSTSVPTAMDFQRAGVYDVNLYYTDSTHINDGVYSFKSSRITIKDNCVGKFSGLNVPGIFNPLYDIRLFFGGAWKNYNEQLGYDELAQTVLWWIFFAILVGGLFATWKFTGAFRLDYPLLCASGLCTILAYLLQYGTHMIVFLMLLSLSLAVPLALTLIPKVENQ